MTEREYIKSELAGETGLTEWELDNLLDDFGFEIKKFEMLGLGGAVYLWCGVAEKWGNQWEM